MSGDLKSPTVALTEIRKKPASGSGSKDGSNSYRHFLQQHRLDEEEFERENHYETCCGIVDKRILEFTVKTMVIFSVLVFAIFQVIFVSPDQRQTYLIIISNVMGLYFSPPTVKSKSYSRR